MIINGIGDEMISFLNDYSEGAHERILDKLVKTNAEQTIGYGEDCHTEKAVAYIRKALRCPDAGVFFVVGGTQANLIFISHVLKPYQAAISVDTGHINTHETGAIEATGHKVYAVPSADGKVTPRQVEEVLAFHHGDEHMVDPRMVYISNPTELGTIYSKKELSALYDLCKKHDLLLYIDGARLASALTSVQNDISLADYPKLCDAVCIGATKCGALFGEALVVMDPVYSQKMRFSIKQKGALLAKGRLLGIQYEGLFEDDLYLRLGEHSNCMAAKLKRGIQKAGYSFLTDSYTNQQFPILSDAVLAKLSENYLFSVWGKAGEDKSVIRLVTSWMTKDADVDSFLRDLQNI